MGKIWDFWETKPTLCGPKLFLSPYYVRNDQNRHTSFIWKWIKVYKLINKGFETLNLAGNLQKRIKCAASLLGRRE